jgi:hypothetical protein|tara:strand:+ start:219 stop:380 length:162 start_codon:yes stop_codon:yes gene_type:complete
MKKEWEETIMFQKIPVKKKIQPNPKSVRIKDRKKRIIAKRNYIDSQLSYGYTT